MGVLLALAAGLFFGLSNITIRQGQLREDMDQFTGMFMGVLINNGFNLLLLTGYIFLGGSPFPPLNYAAVLYYCSAGLLTSHFGRLYLFRSIRYIGPSRTGALKISAPVFTVVLGVVVLKERLSSPVFLGIAIILAAAYLLSQEMMRLNKENSDRVEQGLNSGSEKSLFRKGLITAVLSGALLGSGNVLRKMGVISYPSPLVGVSISSFAALIYMLLLLTKKGNLHGALTKLPHLIKGGYLWTGLLTSLALYATFLALLYAPVSIVNSVKAAEPLFTIAASHLFLRSVEKISKGLVALTLLIITGVVIIAFYS